MTLRHAVHVMQQQGGADSSLAIAIADIDKLLIAADDDTERDAVKRERAQIELADGIRMLLRSELEPVARPVFELIHPFALQGATFPGKRFLIVRDPQISAENREQSWLALSEGEPYLVWIDLGRMRPMSWRDGLPQRFITFENRELKVVWNYFQELNRHQVERFSVMPRLLRQYSRHIADDWQRETGRRPEVRVNSYVMLNYRYPQPLVDPGIDLASTPYNLLGHNDWILPLETQRVSEMWRSRKMRR